MSARYQAHRASEPAVHWPSVICVGVAVALLGWAFLAGILAIGGPAA